MVSRNGYVSKRAIHNLEENLTALETTFEELKAMQDDLSRRVEREEDKGLRTLAQVQVVQDWNQKDEDQKACDIHNVLKRKKFVLLLDDIWAKVNLTEIGVPKWMQTNFHHSFSGSVWAHGADVEMAVECLPPRDMMHWSCSKRKLETSLSYQEDTLIYVKLPIESKGMERAENKGYEIIGSLVRSSLLMENGANDVYLPDVVPEMVLWIGSDFGKKKDNFIVQAGVGLNEIPKIQNWNIVKRMSLMSNKIESTFFLNMLRLVVLDLSGNTNFYELPDEVSQLVSLKYLNMSRSGIPCLPYCGDIGTTEPESTENMLSQPDSFCTNSGDIQFAIMEKIFVVKLRGCTLYEEI
ncbi:hypothetical protein HID58_013671 [Brassica napus]|uniref:NB-ARC domain-containing protein n=1 Tax=Brassica napus TaxID=3708 RepID=A0ABQ8E4M8_BRANA|nr:hypothetical protein HID58_013671 [Brassica napus]